MLRYHVFTVLLLLNFIHSLLAGSEQTCGASFSYGVDNGVHVVCGNSGGAFYDCPYSQCHMSGRSLHEGLFFTNCYTHSTQARFEKVYPVVFSINDPNVTIHYGERLNDEKPPRKVFIPSDRIDCPMRPGYPQNFLRPHCTGCNPHKDK
ncbi:hypothetical protein O181_019518 [Austropuccinia psidii MF-1]|uniref:Uncharacterized protein n=1 Tax=Austropuccinia psidii MF-1 TaxID=1389203 RepID=A0A9Q3CB63_9BASI|nr:hypothetical protein [Austropuccinia psidii MF-1]